MALSFKKQIEQETKKIFEEASRAVEKVTKNAWRVAVTATPHDTYRAENGWKINKGRNVGLVPAIGQYPGTPSTPTFTYDISKDGMIQIYNNVPYISYLEHGQGKGSRTAHKMLFKAGVYWEANMQREFNKIK